MYKYDKIPNDFANFLNIDIQGAELLALKGMGSLISYFDYIYLEVNKAHVYKKCALVNEAMSWSARAARTSKLIKAGMAGLSAIR